MTHDIVRGLRLSGLVPFQLLASSNRQLVLPGGSHAPFSARLANRVGTALVLLLGVAGAASLSGQDPREAAVQRAFNEFDAARRVQLLVSALNPTLGPLRGAWPVAVQLLAQTLIEDGKDSLAAVWLRWAVRQSPDLQPDTLQFLPRVVTAVRSARTFASQTGSPGDSAAATTWQWPAQETGASQGTLRATAPGLVPVKVEVKGVGPIALGGSIPLNPGSYEINASASGYDSLRATREVLPGITTVLEFRLRSTLAQVTPEQPTPPAPPSPEVQKKKKGFPVLLVGVGAAAVGGAVLLLGGHKGATQGGITITFPNP